MVNLRGFPLIVHGLGWCHIITPVFFVLESLSGNFDSLLVTTEQKLSVLERGEVSRQKFERLGKMNRSFDEHTPRSLTYSNP